MVRRKADMEEACPTCGQRPRAKDRPRSDFRRGMDFWAARDAYLAMPWVVLLGIFLVWAGIAYAIEMVKRLVGY